jgi:zinc/manganese transport system ATP-binding protein
MSAALELRGAGASRNGTPVWSGLDLAVGEGEFVAVLGPNGAGKSTLLDVVLGLLPLGAGEVTVLGGLPAAARGRIGYLPQRRSFDAGSRVRGVDLVRLGLDGDRWGLPLPAALSGATREAQRRTSEMIDLVGAGAYAERPIGELSGGEQQRLLIAAALAHRPRLLLLDEPLDSLDLPNQAAVAALIARICRTENVAVMMVAHDVNPILAYLDRVIYLAAGGAVTGTPDAVITSDCLTELYSTPVEVLRTSDGRLVVVGSPEAPATHTDRHEH